jgi:prepilin-type N-terminal cleavage/methylation domain-containing protein
MKKGFTLVELMMVMVVLAIIATLATGAAMKSIRQAKEQRINATQSALELALVNYRAAEGRWPSMEGAISETNKCSFGKDNYKVFGPLLTSKKRVYLDPASLLTKVDGEGVISLRDALEKKISPDKCPIGYPNPSKANDFRYYKVTINLEYDTVKVSR